MRIGSPGCIPNRRKTGVAWRWESLGLIGSCCRVSRGSYESHRNDRPNRYVLQASEHCVPRLWHLWFQRPLALSFGTDRRTERRIDRESRLGMDQTHCSRFSMSTVGIVEPPSRPARRNPSKDSRKPQETIRSSRRNVPFDTRRGHRDRSQERLCGPRAASTPRTCRPRNLGLAPRHFPNHEAAAVSGTGISAIKTSPLGQLRSRPTGLAAVPTRRRTISSGARYSSTPERAV